MDIQGSPLRSLPIFHTNEIVIRLNIESSCFKLCSQRLRVRIATQYKNTFCINLLRRFDNFVFKEILSDVVFGNPMIDRGSRVRIFFRGPITTEYCAPYTSFKSFLSRHHNIFPSNSWSVEESFFLRDG